MGFVRSTDTTDTVPLTVLAAYTRVPSGETATPLGSVPTAISVTGTFCPPVTLNRVTLLLSGFATASKVSSAFKARGCELIGPVNRAGPAAETLETLL